MNERTPEGRTPEIDISHDDRRALADWAAACARRALPHFETELPSDPRAREAIDAALAYAQGGPRTARLRDAAWAAHAAAKQATHRSASAAARASAHAAASAFIHGLATPHQTNHVLAAASAAAYAIEVSGGGDRALGDAEIDLAIELASADVRELLRRLPEPRLGRSRLAELSRRLDDGLR